MLEKPVLMLQQTLGPEQYVVAWYIKGDVPKDLGQQGTVEVEDVPTNQRGRFKNFLVRHGFVGPLKS